MKTKTKRFQIFVNGKYLESYTKIKEAAARVRIYERQDRYEQSIGYTNPLAVYDIREASNN